MVLRLEFKANRFNRDSCPETLPIKHGDFVFGVAGNVSERALTGMSFAGGIGAGTQSLPDGLPRVVPRPGGSA